MWIYCVLCILFFSFESPWIREWWIMWYLTKISALNCWNSYSALNNCFGFVLIPSSRIVMTNLQLLNVNMLHYFCIQDFTELWIGMFIVKGVFGIFSWCVWGWGPITPPHLRILLQGQWCGLLFVLQIFDKCQLYWVTSTDKESHH